MEKNVRAREGFSLIEVIVAVAILAVLSMPILLYFTNSAIHSANGRHEQSADMAAQSIVEEIDSMVDFSSIEGSLGTTLDAEGNPVWTVSNIATQAKDSNGALLPKWDGISRMSRDITVNDNQYKAVVDIDYNDPVYIKEATPAPSATPIAAQYNKYKTPHFSELYSDSSVVISERNDVYDIGMSDLFYQLNGSSPTLTNPTSTSMEDIQKNSKRIFVLNVVKKPGDDDTYVIQAKFRYIYPNTGAELARSEVPLENTQIAKDKLKNIYFLFRPIWSCYNYKDSTTNTQVVISPAAAEEEAWLDFSGVPWGASDTEEKISVSFIKQKVDGVTEDASHKYRITFKNSTGGAETYDNNRVRFYCNTGVFLPDAFNYDANINQFGDNPPSLVKQTYDKRIAKITIKIYDLDTFTDYDNPGTLRATIETSKSI